MNYIKVKLDCHWTSPTQLLHDLKKLIPQRSDNLLVRDNILFVDSNDFDYVVVFNAGHQQYPQSKTLYFQCEADWVMKNNNFPTNQYLTYNYGLSRYHCPIMWYIDKSYDYINTNTPEKTEIISAIVSGLSGTEFQSKRLDFIYRYLYQLSFFQHYGRGIDRPIGNNYKGLLNCKSEGLLPYKYTFISENTIQTNYFTEKLIDPIMCETLCFYSGCPNASEWIDNKAYIPINLNDPEQAFMDILTAIFNNEWESRIGYIRNEKNRILNETNILAFIAREVNKIKGN